MLKKFPRFVFPALLITLAATVFSAETGLVPTVGGVVPEPTPQEKASTYLYKGIGIGTPTEEVRTKLGNPKDKSDSQDFYTYGDDESAQFIYDSDKKVSAIMITFSGKISQAPTAKDVFGEEVEAKPDGGLFK